MTKRRLNLRHVVAMTICLAGMTMFSGCDKDNDPPAISVTDNKTLTQEVFADNVQGKSGVSFTTTGAWTSSISEVSPSTKSGQTKAGTNPPDWISISPESGGAGTHTIAITLKTNTTGTDRTAVITISCNGDEIKITVTQKGTTQSGEIPTLVLKLVSRIDDLRKDNHRTFEYQYDTQNRLKTIIFTDESGSETITVTYPNTNTIFISPAPMYEYGNATFTLNNNGYVGLISGQYDINITYINDYLHKVEVSDYSETYSWNNGNMTNVLETTGSWTLEYGNILNKPCSIDLGYLFISEIAAYMPYGWFGKSTINLPSKRTRPDAYVLTFRYETDSNGYPLKIFAKSGTDSERLYFSISYQ